MTIETRDGGDRWAAVGVVAAFLAAGLAGCAKAPPAMPESARMLHYEIPWEGAFPSDVAVDDEGRLWFTDRLTHSLGVFDPETERFDRYPTPTGLSAPYGLVRAPDGAFWFGESNAGRLGRLDPETREIREVEIPGLERTGAMLVAWADGAVWFTARDDSGVFGRHVPATGETRIWRGVLGPGRIYGIAATPAGAVWVAKYSGDRIYRIDERQDSSTSVDLGIPYLETLPPARLEGLTEDMRRRLGGMRSGPRMRRIAAGPDGWVWAAGFGRSRVTGIDPTTGDTIHVRTVAQPSRPYGIVVDDLGRVWFSEQGNDLLVVYEPRSDRRSALPLPVPGGTVRNIAVDLERGRVWLPLSDVGVIAVLEIR